MIELHLDQGSPDWLAARAGAITASRFKDALSVLKRASGDRKAGEPTSDSIKYAQLIAMERIAGEPLDDTFVTWQMRRGIELEPIARDLYMARTGRIVDRAGIIFTDDKLFGYSTDGKVFDEPGGLEIKCPAAADKMAGVWLDPGPVIDEYLHQIVGGLWLTGWEWVDLVVYTPWLAPVGKDLFISRVHRAEAAVEQLETELWAFAKRVQAIEQALRRPLDQFVDARTPSVPVSAPVVPASIFG